MTTPGRTFNAALDTVLDAVGSTPMVRLSRVVPPGVEVAVKLEFFSPSGSVKDRIVPYIVRTAIAAGRLCPGMSIIEGTTGNTGIATAMTGAALGYPVVIAMPEGMSAERRRAIAAYGATLVLTPGGESDVDLVLERVRQIMAESPGRYFLVDQFANPLNVRAHYETTGPEIWAQTGGKIDLFVAAAGTGGTLTGVARYLKEQDGRVVVAVAEPAECAVLSGGAWGEHAIEGVGDGILPDIMDLDLIDGAVRVTSDEALAMARRLAREEGIFCGVSSGCNVAAAIRAATRLGRERAVTIISDNGLRYLSTALCDATEKAAQTSPPRPHPLPDFRRLPVIA